VALKIKLYCPFHVKLEFCEFVVATPHYQTVSCNHLRSGIVPSSASTNYTLLQKCPLRMPFFMNMRRKTQNIMLYTATSFFERQKLKSLIYSGNLRQLLLNGCFDLKMKEMLHDMRLGGDDISKMT
jgi:hypothetical protein